jgi:hypothetical protein
MTKRVTSMQTAKQSRLLLKTWFRERCASLGDPMFARLCPSTDIRALNLFGVSGQITQWSIDTHPQYTRVAMCGDYGVMPLSTFCKSMKPSPHISRRQDVRGCCLSLALEIPRSQLISSSDHLRLLLLLLTPFATLFGTRLLLLPLHLFPRWPVMMNRYKHSTPHPPRSVIAKKERKNGFTPEERTIANENRRIDHFQHHRKGSEFSRIWKINPDLGGGDMNVNQDFLSTYLLVPTETKQAAGRPSSNGAGQCPLWEAV